MFALLEKFLRPTNACLFIIDQNILKCIDLELFKVLLFV